MSRLLLLLHVLLLASIFSILQDLEEYLPDTFFIKISATDTGACNGKFYQMLAAVNPPDCVCVSLLEPQSFTLADPVVNVLGHLRIPEIQPDEVGVLTVVSSDTNDFDHVIGLVFVVVGNRTYHADPI